MILKKKRELSILLYVFMISVFSNLIIAESYNTSSPIIEVIYGEIPVKILKYNLSDIYGGLWKVYPITTPLDGFKAYNFSTYYLDNGNYTFYILAEDLDGNTVGAYREFEINHKSMNVWLISPIPAISKTRIFNITIGTEYNATCKWGHISDNSCNASCRFNNMPYFFDITTNKTIHKIFYNAPDTDMELFVFCRNDLPEANKDDPSNYGGTHFMTGYDTNKPNIISSTANPNPVIDWNNKKTEIKVITNEPTVCYINGGNSSVNNGLISRYFPDENVSIYTSYRTEHLLNISYNVYDSNPYTFIYNISCVDRAGWYVEKFLSVIVNLSGTLIITQVTPELTNKLDILYEIKTSINTIGCSLKLNNGIFQDMNKNDYRNYTLGITLAFGVNNITVNCTAYPNSKTANFRIIADNEPPSLEILMHNYTCSLNKISFILNATDRGTGRDYFNYSIWKNNSMIKSWTKTTDTNIVYNGNLIEGEKYTVKAYVVDKVSLKSDTKEKTIIATSDSLLECDLISPIANITYTDSLHQKNVTVRCTDNTGGSGCTVFFDYVLEKLNSTCNNVSYINRMLYSDLPLVITNNSLLCVRVSDNAGNFGYAKRLINITPIPPRCGNNIVEPPEECDGSLEGVSVNMSSFINCTYGIICSNECKVRCDSRTPFDNSSNNSCNNLIKDGLETDVDCGGVCNPCLYGQKCLKNSDCKSNICINQKCEEDVCENGFLDEEETDVDCGGACSPCNSGKKCKTNDDCQSGICKNKICESEKPIEEKNLSVSGMLFILIGSLLFLGGSVYLFYKKSFKKNISEVKTNTQQALPLQQSQKIVDPKILEVQRKKIEEKRQKQQEQRKSLLEGFDRDSVETKDIQKLKENPSNELLEESEYVDLTTEKRKQSKTEDLFKNLEKITSEENPIDYRLIKNNQNVSHDVIIRNKDLDHYENNIEIKNRKKSKIIKLEKKSELFNKLKEIGSNVNIESGKDSKYLSREIFKNVSREEILSEEFIRKVKELIDKNALDVQSFRNFLFENISNGKLQKSEVAKIMHILGLI